MGVKDPSARRPDLGLASPSPEELGMPSIAEQVAQVPTEPGCYLWKDGRGEVIYVGKAKNLRSRMLQYVNLTDDRAKIPLMMQVVRSFDYVVVGSEHEALVLERNLIAQYHPYFNVDFKDDKSYPYIAITEDDAFPAIKYTRERHRKGTRYFGPYTDSHAARETIDTLRKAVPICIASCTEWKRARRYLKGHPDDVAIANLVLGEHCRPCFDYHVGRGPGVCCGQIDTVDYAAHVRQVEKFLSGRRAEICGELEDQMHEAASNLEFERAARIKRRLEVIDGLDDRQQVTFPTSVNLDLIGFYREETISCACVFVVREGRTIRSSEFILNKGADVDEVELTGGFVKRYYDETADIPAEVDVRCALPDAELLGGWLTEKRGLAVHVHRPQRGEKSHLLDMAERNARHALMRIKAIAAKDNIFYVKFESKHNLCPYQFISKIFDTFAKYRTPLCLLVSSNQDVSVAIDNSEHLCKILAELEQYAKILMEDRMSIVSVVGNMRWQYAGVEAQIIEALADIPLRMISYGSNDSDVAFVIKTEDKKRALQALSNRLFEPETDKIVK